MLYSVYHVSVHKSMPRAENCDGGDEMEKHTDSMDIETMLGLNQKAKERFDALTETEKRLFLEKGRKLATRETMREHVSELAGWVDPHPPYQL